MDEWKLVLRDGPGKDGTWLEYVEVPGGRLYRTIVVIDHDDAPLPPGVAMCFVPARPKAKPPRREPGGLRI